MPVTPHSEQGARPGEHYGRSLKPVIKVHDLAWLEFQKPDLARAQAFAHAFGFTTVSRSADDTSLLDQNSGSRTETAKWNRRRQRAPITSTPSPPRVMA